MSAQLGQLFDNWSLANFDQMLKQTSRVTMDKIARHFSLNELLAVENVVPAVKQRNDRIFQAVRIIELEVTKDSTEELEKVCNILLRCGPDLQEVILGYDDGNVQKCLLPMLVKVKRNLMTKLAERSKNIVSFRVPKHYNCQSDDDWPQIAKYAAACKGRCKLRSLKLDPNDQYLYYQYKVLINCNQIEQFLITRLVNGLQNEWLIKEIYYYIANPTVRPVKLIEIAQTRNIDDLLTILQLTHMVNDGCEILFRLNSFEPSQTSRVQQIFSAMDMYIAVPKYGILKFKANAQLMENIHCLAFRWCKELILHLEPMDWTLYKRLIAFNFIRKIRLFYAQDEIFAILNSDSFGSLKSIKVMYCNCGDHFLNLMRHRPYLLNLNEAHIITEDHVDVILALTNIRQPIGNFVIDLKMSKDEKGEEFIYRPHPEVLRQMAGMKIMHRLRLLFHSKQLYNNYCDVFDSIEEDNSRIHFYLVPDPENSSDLASGHTAYNSGQNDDGQVLTNSKADDQTKPLAKKDDGQAEPLVKEEHIDDKAVLGPFAYGWNEGGLVGVEQLLNNHMDHLEVQLEDMEFSSIPVEDDSESKRTS